MRMFEPYSQHSLTLHFDLIKISLDGAMVARRAPAQEVLCSNPVRDITEVLENKRNVKAIGMVYYAHFCKILCPQCTFDAKTVNHKKYLAYF